jgi:hypothetical protein
MLGKSIATVRRMEGTSLHPVCGRDGVWLFDEDEVRNVMREAGRDRRTLTQLPRDEQDHDWFADLQRQRKDNQQVCDAIDAGHSSRADAQDIRERVVVLERLALDRFERTASRQVVVAERRRKTEQQQLLAAVREILEAISELGPRQLLKLNNDVWRYLDEAIRHLEDDE